MLNKKVQKIIASFMVISSLAVTIAVSTTEAGRKHHNEHKYHHGNHKEIDLEEENIYMGKVRVIMEERNIHVPPGHWVYGKRVPQKVMVQYRESNDDDNQDLLIGLILGAVIAEAMDND
ncbi:MAG: hypothetical protein ACRC8T_07460 [Acidaminococcaceae bacterium]